MPRRAVSPVALETCSPSPSEIDPESDLLGSDEELNDEERAAKRQRIEKLARAHLQGRPLFILSASLKGPFGDGWSNPWKKNRRKNQEVNPGRTERNTNRRRVSASPEPVVQETDPQPLRFSRNSVSGSRSPAKQAPGPGTKLSTKPLVPDSASPTPNGARKTKPPSARPARTSEKSRPASTSKFFANTSNDQLPDIDEHTFAKIEPTDWLKRDGRRSNFHSTGGLPSSHSAKSTVKEENALSNPQNHAPSVNTPSSPSKRSALTTSSFNVVSSTSQLPRFEYRKHRRHVSSPGVKPASHRRNSRAEDCNRPSSRSISQAQETGDGDGFDAGDIGAVDAGSEMADVPPERNENQPPPKDPNLQLSKSLRFATDTEGAVSTCTGPPPSTEQNTYPELPSAQEVPGPLGVSDRAISLHSTVVPKDTNTYQKTSPDTQLSTQAALMHAQRSFQDDLSSPPDQHGMTPLGRKEIAELGNDSLLARETPLSAQYLGASCASKLQGDRKGQVPSYEHTAHDRRNLAIHVQHGEETKIFSTHFAIQEPV
ncbi:hypothetical protein N7470_003461 [Penicillium chermesinum]|nr:hypothetical protein N7470_003461 [Penicillium chermesinum]